MRENKIKSGLGNGKSAFASGALLFGVLLAGVLMLGAAAVRAQQEAAGGEVAVEEKEQAAADKAAEAVTVKGATLGRVGEGAAVDAEQFEFAAAEVKLWLDSHLENIEKPSHLRYEFVKSGSYEEGFTDSVNLYITAINADGTRQARLEFFSADRRQQVNADNVTDITGNPVLVAYMQGDVYEMSRLTGGSWRYFQRRVKLAFAQTARIEEVTFRYRGEEVRGEKISITPYLSDPRRRQFEEFAVKSYEFILSDSVPGKLFQIKTVVPDRDDPERPLLQEVLTLRGADS